MFDLETLKQLASTELIEAAEAAMDLESVSAYRFDRRGRLEGGVKPAPPSTEPPAYVRVTKRGSKCLVDCRVHGRGPWCIHGAILALYHLGRKPYLKPKPRPAPAPASVAKVGVQLVAVFDADGARFQIRGRSTGGAVANPLRFAKRELRALALTPRALELIEDLAEPGEDALTIDRLDLAPLLIELADTPLFAPDGQAYAYGNAGRPEPRTEVEIKDNVIVWRVVPAIEKGSVFAPGWPGFVVEGRRILRFPGYVPDLQSLAAADSPLPLTAENLAIFARQKHGVEWRSAKPEVLDGAQSPGIRLRVAQRTLVGELGLWRGDHFYPLADLSRPLQIAPGPDRPTLLALSQGTRRELSRSRDRVKSAWRGGRFQLREGQARRFLEETRFPEGWRIDREGADRWFGVERLPLETDWSGDALAPRYRVADEWFGHDALMGGLLAGGGGVRLADGRTLNIDAGEVLANQRVLEGVRAIHQDATAQRVLLGRMLDPAAPRPSTVETAPRWREILRDYQLEGAQWLIDNFAAGEPSLLADDMGLGKTVQTLAFLDSVKDDRPQLIVAPASLLLNWRAECQRFCPHRRVAVHHGSKRAKTVEALQACDLVATSYGSLRRDVDLLYGVEFQVVVLDEAQAIKNPASQTARAAGELWAEGRVALTGTPVENRLVELWSIFQFLAPGYLGEEEDARAVSTPGTASFRAFKAKAAPFLKRRLKRDVEPSLPEKQEITVNLPLSEAQQALYQRLLRSSREDVADGKADAVSILAKLTRLRQACCHPGLVDERLVQAESNKLEFLLERAAEVVESGHAALVFSQFTTLLKLLRFQLEERGLDYLYLDGQTKNRQALVDRFQAGEKPLFLISLKAGGVGLNLTRASYVYHLDPWWNPMVEAQASDRAHRIGQTRKVLSYKLISENTVEEKILKLQAGKKWLADGLWRDQDQGPLDREALLALLT